MNNQRFRKAAKARSRKAMILTIMFHSFLIAGIMVGTSTNTQFMEKIEQFWKDSNNEKPNEKSKPKSKKKKPRA